MRKKYNGCILCFPSAIFPRIKRAVKERWSIFDTVLLCCLGWNDQDNFGNRVILAEPFSDDGYHTERTSVILYSPRPLKRIGSVSSTCTDDMHTRIEIEMAEIAKGSFIIN